MLLALGWGWHRHNFPYGATHKCNKGIYFALFDYAGVNEGKFPDAGSSAASLSLLATDPYTYPIDQLAGKAISDKDAERCFREKGKLTEEFCSWHYVRGLTTESDPSLLLFWDKTGLMHNGQRPHSPKYEVCFVSGNFTMISESGWPDFLSQQAKLLEEAGLSPDLLKY